MHLQSRCSDEYIMYIFAEILLRILRFESVVLQNIDSDTVLFIFRNPEVPRPVEWKAARWLWNTKLARRGVVRS